MTATPAELDLQEALSFRYIAPRIVTLSSGNIAIIPMLGREPPTIVAPTQFHRGLIPNLTQLEAEQLRTEAEMRVRASPPSSRSTPKPTMDDLA